MSLVGTRPPTVDEWDKYELHHRARLATKPGLTGMWQVSGRSNITDFEEVVKLDKQYISEWTIHDAIEAGFNHVVFIIRKDIEKEFKEVIGDRIAAICSAHDVTVDYAFQDLNDIPGTLPEGRTKPWGTGQAVLAAKKVINSEPRLDFKETASITILGQRITDLIVRVELESAKIVNLDIIREAVKTHKTEQIQISLIPGSNGNHGTRMVVL